MSASTTTSKQILIAGLKSGPNPGTTDEWTPEQIRDAITIQIERAGEAGFIVANYQVDLSKSQDTVVDEFRAVLREKHWDGVSIGYGVRGNQSLTPLFERLVNAVVEEVQPPPKFMFALRPNSIWEAISRGFGVEQ